MFPVDPAFTAPPGVPLTLGYVYDRLHQELLAPAPPAGAAAGGYGLMVDTGDSMLRTHCMRLPRGTPYELQVCDVLYDTCYDACCDLVDRQRGSREGRGAGVCCRWVVQIHRQAVNPVPCEEGKIKPCTLWEGKIKRQQAALLTHRTPSCMPG